MTKTRRKPGKLSGLYDPKDPHISFTQLSMADSCEAWHEAEYAHGRKKESREAAFGKTGHEAIAMVNRALTKHRDGISPEDLEGAKRHLAGFRSYGLYARFCEWMERYAERANAERTRIIGVELTVWAWLKLGAIDRNPRKIPLLDLKRRAWVTGPCGDAAVKLVGQIDRLDRGAKARTAVPTDFKTWGVIPSREELEDDLQLGLYDWALRQKHNAEEYDLNPNEPWERRWVSIMHGVPIAAVSETRNAEDVERFARDLVRKLVENPSRAETFHRRCLYCPRSVGMECRTFKAVVQGGEKNGGVVTPSLGEYERLGSRIAVLTGLREQVKTSVVTRTERMAGPLLEDGLKAELVVRAGGLSEEYAGMTREQLLESLTRQPHSALKVTRVGVRPRR